MHSHVELDFGRWGVGRLRENYSGLERDDKERQGVFYIEKEPP